MGGEELRLSKRFFEEPSACLAPIAGYTDAPFRLVCSELGADFTFTGLVSADGIARGAEKSAALMRRLAGESPLGVQLFGAHPEEVGSAAAVAERSGASFVDLNFGCPVKKVIRKNGGAALMRDLDLMGRIAREAVASVSIPVTAKIRSGWSAEERNFRDAGLVLASCGIAAVTLHPRPRSQGFSGHARWEDIAELRAALPIPVIANGDIRSVADYREVTAIAGRGSVMIGRGALGNPWLFRGIKECAAGCGEPREAGLAERVDLMERHARLMADFFGEYVGLREMRKFYRWYLRAFEGVSRHRAALATAESLAGVVGIIARLREERGLHARSAAEEIARRALER